MRNIFLTISLSFATSVLAAPAQRVEITYEVNRNNLILAEVTHRLEHDGRAYKLTETWQGRGFLALKGDATRTSEGAIAAGGLRPRKFEDERSGRDTLHAEFYQVASKIVLQ